MTEKRFRHNGSMIFDDRKALNTIDVVELLNMLHEENQSLKKEIENNIDSFKENNRKRLELEKENEELKQQNRILDESETLSIENSLRLSDEVVRLEKENEQLKQRIKVLENTIDGLTGTIAHFDLDEVMGND